MPGAQRACSHARGRRPWKHYRGTRPAPVPAVSGFWAPFQQRTGCRTDCERPVEAAPGGQAALTPACHCLHLSLATHACCKGTVKKHFPLLCCGSQQKGVWCGNVNLPSGAAAEQPIKREGQASRQAGVYGRQASRKAGVLKRSKVGVPAPKHGPEKTTTLVSTHCNAHWRSRLTPAAASWARQSPALGGSDPATAAPGL